LQRVVVEPQKKKRGENKNSEKNTNRRGVVKRVNGTRMGEKKKKYFIGGRLNVRKNTAARWHNT